MTRRSWSWEQKQAEVERKEKQERWTGLGAYTSWSFMFPGHAPGLTEFSFPVYKPYTLTYISGNFFTFLLNAMKLRFGP